MMRLGIRGRVMLVAVAPALTIALLLAVYFTQVRFADLERSLQATGLAQARQLALAAEHGVFSGSRDALEALAIAVAREANVVGVSIRGRDGRVLAGHGQIREVPQAASGAREPVQAEDGHGQTLTTRAPIFLTRLELEEIFDTVAASGDSMQAREKPRLLGYADVTLSKAALIVQRNRLLRDGVLVALFVLAGGVALAMRMARAVTRPVGSLTETVQRLANGNLDVRITPDPGGAIPELEQGVNVMAGALQSATSNLERRIADATAELARKTEEAQQADAAKSRFLASASHDLRQPLHAMGLYVEALRGKRLSEENRRVIAQMAKSVAALQDLLDALLDISRLDAGSVRPIASAFALNPLLTRMQSQYAPDAIAKGVTFRFVPTRITVRSDPHLLERIVMNLVSNAVRYTQPGKVLLGCRRAGASVRIEVWDTGVGIAPEQQRLIFEEFYRIEGFGQDQERGYGLGLATVDRLARLLRHSVELRSVVGKGSVFTVTVPLAEAAAECGEGADRYRAVRSLKGVVVLVIDDDAQARGAMQTLLARWGCDVLTVSSGTEAVSLATTPGRPWPQIVISDYWLARDETGAQVLDRLCAAGSARFQGILVTGDASVEVVNAAHDRGYPLIQKPVRPARLRALLEHCLRLSSDRRDR